MTGKCQNYKVIAGFKFLSIGGAIAGFELVVTLLQSRQAFLLVIFYLF